jgi:hypothetical protein
VIAKLFIEFSGMPELQFGTTAGRQQQRKCDQYQFLIIARA